MVVFRRRDFLFILVHGNFLAAQVVVTIEPGARRVPFFFDGCRHQPLAGKIVLRGGFAVFLRDGEVQHGNVPLREDHIVRERDGFGDIVFFRFGGDGDLGGLVYLTGIDNHPDGILADLGAAVHVHFYLVGGNAPFLAQGALCGVHVGAAGQGGIFRSREG